MLWTLAFTAAATPSLWIEGPCPGPATVTVRDLTAGALVASPHAGADALVRGPCAGTVTDLTDPRLVAVLTDADGDLAIVHEVVLPEAACGVTVQLVETATCLVRDTFTVPDCRREDYCDPADPVCTISGPTEFPLGCALDFGPQHLVFDASAEVTNGAHLMAASITLEAGSTWGTYFEETGVVLESAGALTSECAFEGYHSAVSFIGETVDVGGHLDVYGITIDARRDLTFSGDIYGARELFVAQPSTLSFTAGEDLTIAAPVFAHPDDAPMAITAAGTCHIASSVRADGGALEVSCDAIEVVEGGFSSKSDGVWGYFDSGPVSVTAVGDIVFTEGGADAAADGGSVTLVAGGDISTSGTVFEAHTLDIRAEGTASVDGDLVSPDTDTPSTATVSATAVTVSGLATFAGTDAAVAVTAADRIDWSADVGADVAMDAPTLDFDAPSIALDGDWDLALTGAALAADGVDVTIAPSADIHITAEPAMDGPPAIDLTATGALRVDGSLVMTTTLRAAGDITLTGCSVDVRGAVETTGASGGVVTLTAADALVVSGDVTAGERILVSSTPPVLDLSGSLVPVPIVEAGPAPLCD